MALLRGWLNALDPLIVLGLVALVLFAWLVRKALAGWGWRECVAFHRREDGAAYSLSYVLTFPFFLWLVCLVVESALFLVVKVGTVYAAYAGARSHVVWQSTDPSRVQAKREQAAINVMAGFASSSSLHARGAGLTGTPPPDATRFYNAYKKFAEEPAAQHYIIAKYRYAGRATTVAVKETGGPDGDVTATVTYEMPFHTPIIGRIIGSPAPWPGSRFYTYAVVSTVTLQNEAPRSDSRRLGIDYVVP